MENLERHVDRLLELATDSERGAYLRATPELATAEGARVLCRSAVALSSRDLSHSQAICHSLNELALLLPEHLVLGYRDHAWAAQNLQSGSNYRVTVGLWKAALQHFEAAGRPDEAAITSYCGLATLDFVRDTELFWLWEARARQHFEATGDRLRLARLNVNVGVMHLRKDEWREATCLFEDAYRSLASIGNSHDLKAVLSNLAVCYERMGDLPRALNFLERARNECEDEGLFTELVYAEHQMASILHLHGDLGRAITLIRNARKYNESHGSEHALIDADLIEADILLSLNLPSEAQERAASALDRATSLGVDYERARALVTLGLCAGRRGRTAQALSFLERAFLLFNELGNLQRARTCQLHRARVIFENGDQVLSLALARDLVDATASDASTSLSLQCRLLLCRILVGQERASEAQGLVEDILSGISVLDQAPLEAQAFHLVGRMHELKGDLHAAYDAYVRSERCLSRMRWHLKPGELSHSFVSGRSELCEALFLLELSVHKRPDRALHFAEKVKSRTLADLLARRTPSISADAQRSNHDVYRLWGILRASLEQLDHIETFSDLARNGSTASLRRNVAAAEFATRGMLTPQRRSSQPGEESLPTIDAIADGLSDSTALVEFFIARQTVFAILLQRGRVEIVDLCEAARLEQLCRLLLFQVGSSVHSLKEHGLLRSTTYLKKLHDLAWSPINKRVDAEHLLVVPHGFLHQIPFHALFDGHEYLIERHTVTYSPSASVAHIASTRALANEGTMVVIGAADSLAPSIAAEVESISEIMPNCRMLIDEDATRDRLRQILPGARYIHIAAHAAFSAEDPSASFLSLQDGTLTVGDLRSLPLSAELVVLSGCETGRSATRGADELVGLTQAVLEAGARSSLVSLWRVDDGSTASFMHRFYSQLAKQDSPRRALQQTIIEHQTGFPHPFFWAPFILVGAPH